MLGDTALGGRRLGLAWARYTAWIGRLDAGGGGLWLLFSSESVLSNSSESVLSKSSLLSAGEAGPSESVVSGLLLCLWLLFSSGLVFSSTSESVLCRSSLHSAGGAGLSESVLSVSLLLALLFWALVVAPAGVGIRCRIESP